MFEMEIEMFDAMDDDFMFWGLGSAHSTQHTAHSRIHSTSPFPFGSILLVSTFLEKFGGQDFDRSGILGQIWYLRQDTQQEARKSS